MGAVSSVEVEMAWNMHDAEFALCPNQLQDELNDYFGPTELPPIMGVVVDGGRAELFMMRVSRIERFRRSRDKARGQRTAVLEPVLRRTRDGEIPNGISKARLPRRHQGRIAAVKLQLAGARNFRQGAFAA